MVYNLDDVDNQTLFKSGEYQKYNDIVSFKNVENAKKSARKLDNEFKNAKSKSKKLRVARVTQYSGNRALASAKNKNLSKKEKEELENIGYIYQGHAKSMWASYKKVK